MPWWRRGWRSGWARMRTKCSRRWRSLKGAPGRMEKVAFSVERRAHLCRLRPYAGCAGEGAEGAAPAHRKQAARDVRLRRRPRQGQASPDGPDRGGAGRRCDRHRRQSPQRRSRHHPQGSPGHRARRRARSATAPRPSAPASPRCRSAMCWCWPARAMRPANMSKRQVRAFLRPRGSGEGGAGLGRARGMTLVDRRRSRSRHPGPGQQGFCRARAFPSTRAP